jgi:hypothetical protein
MTPTGSTPSSTSVRLVGGHQLRGARRLPRRTVLVSVIGGATLDLSQAEVPPEGATIVKVSLIGGVNLIAPPGVQVVVSGFSLFGGRSGDGGSTSGPVLKIAAFGIMGGVRVRAAGV